MTYLNDQFETPALLLHLGLVVAVAWLSLAARSRRRRVLADWPRVLQSSDRQRGGWQWWLAIRVAGLSCLVVALAGPRGSSPAPLEEARGRDLMIVLDISRSMNAEQPSRLDKAIRSLQTLTDDKRLPAGTRVGLVVFAARPWLMFPLTRDVDHLSATLDRLAAGDIPLEVRADSETLISGTRLGAALKLAVDSFPSKRPGRQDIVLLSDGDDPVADDEWLAGLTVARTRGLPVHTVVVGEPGIKATIPHNGDVLRFEGEIVNTEVQRDRLDDIAGRTGGLSATLERGELPLAGLLAKRWSQASPPAEDVASATNARPIRRFPWLLAAFLALLAEAGFAWPKSLWPRRGQVGRVSDPSASARRLHRPALLATALFSLATISAAPSAQSALRRGQDAYARQDYAAAIAAFDEAQPLLPDPGLAAFNRAAAHFRLGQFAAAAADYRCVLDDAAIPAERRDRARFDLGNSLLHQAGPTDRRLLEDAIAAYRQCLAGSPDATLKRDAEHNLAIASRRWLKTQPPEDKKQNNSDTSDPTDPEVAKSGNPQKSPDKKAGPNQVGDPSTTPPDGNTPSSKAPALGSITVLPDETTPLALTPEQTAATLAAQARRIAQERRQYGHSRDIVSPQGKDW